MELHTEILIIGGGATGMGLARDLSLRGLSCVLVEKGDFASGSSGRNQGLLHSGARYAASDPHTASECIGENRILRRIAPRFIEPTGGLFVSLPGDSLDFRDRFVDACFRAGIETSIISPEQALEREPHLAPHLLGAVEVPDGVIDPFGLVLANGRDAEDHGAKLLSRTEVTSIVVSRRRVEKVTARDLVTGEDLSIIPSYVVNATGAWASDLLALAGLKIGLALSKGAMLITNRRLTRMVVNRCRPASDGDIIAPNDTVSILGTTSSATRKPEEWDVSPAEVFLIIAETAKMVPEIDGGRLIRAYAGVRPLFRFETVTPGQSGRAISRGFALVDHGERNELSNLITVTGGKLVTYRLMAEKTADLLCEKMGIKAPCSTHLKGLPDLTGAAETGLYPQGDHRQQTPRGDVVCDCEIVRRDEIERFVGDVRLRVFTDVLHRTRLAKGTCQGAFCAFRLMAMLHDMKAVENNSTATLHAFLEERWKGVRPVLWGEAVKEAELVETIYRDLFNLDAGGANSGV
ncbi:MAG: anaerobic glycerol-3-phosphate dehydrogenase subunit GlpA [Syntrophorhabdales bacterium]|jgi:glycerol-3-phosphate dehydrogenase